MYNYAGSVFPLPFATPFLRNRSVFSSAAVATQITDSRSMKGVVCVALVGVVMMCVNAASAVEMNGPPIRPVAFHNPQELREYLKALNDYYAIVGRPRFGRSADGRYETKGSRELINDGDLAA